MHLPLSNLMLLVSLTSALPDPDPTTETLPEDITSLAGGGHMPTATQERAAAVTPNNDWAMTTWSARGCNTGDIVHWITPSYGFKGCTTLTNVLSLEVKNWGTCDTYFYTDPGCQNQNTVNVQRLNVCQQYPDSASQQLIRSFFLYCHDS